MLSSVFSSLIACKCSMTATPVTSIAAWHAGAQRDLEPLRIGKAMQGTDNLDLDLRVKASVAPCRVVDVQDGLPEVAVFRSAPEICSQPIDKLRSS